MCFKSYPLSLPIVLGGGEKKKKEKRITAKYFGPHIVKLCISSEFSNVTSVSVLPVRKWKVVLHTICDVLLEKYF